MNQSDIYSYHAADYALPDPQRTVDLIGQSRCEQFNRQDAPQHENQVNMPLKSGMHLIDQKSPRFYQRKEQLNRDIIELPFKKQLPSRIGDQGGFSGLKTRNQTTTLLGNTASTQQRMADHIPDIIKTAQTFCHTSDDEGVFSHQKSPLTNLSRPFFQRQGGDELPATTQTLQTVSRHDHNTQQQQQLQQHDSNSKYMLLSNESVSNNNMEENSSNHDYPRYFIDQPNFVDMNLQTIQKRIQEVLKSKEQRKLLPKQSQTQKKSFKRSTTHQRSTGQPTQGSSAVKHKFKAQEVLQLTEKYIPQPATTVNLEKRRRSKSKGSTSLTGKKYSKEEKQRIIEYLLKDQAVQLQSAEKVHRRFPNFSENESCDVPFFNHGHLSNEQIMNILAERNEIEMQKVEGNLYKPISKSVQKKETNDQDVQASDEGEVEDNALSFGRQTFLHSRNTSNPPQQSKSKDFRAEYMRLSEQLISQAQNLDRVSLTPKNMNNLFLVSDGDLRSYHERILTQVRRVSTSGKSNVFQQLYDMRNRSSERLEKIRIIAEQEKEDNYKRNCTFQPNIGNSSAQRTFSPLSPNALGSMQIQEFSLTRSPKQFYEDQMDFKQSVQEKISKIKEQLIEQEAQKIRDFKNQMSQRRQKSIQQRQEAAERSKEMQQINTDLSILSPKSIRKQQAQEKEVIDHLGNSKRKVDYDRIFKLYNDAQKLEQNHQQLKDVYQKQRQQSFELANRRSSQSPKCADYNSSRLIKELRATYHHLSLAPETDMINYLQLVMVLQTMNYINKQRASDEENQLLVEAWNSLKTRQYSVNGEEHSISREGISFQNLVNFLHAMHYINHTDLEKSQNTAAVESNLYESRPFGHISTVGNFFVKSDQEAFKIHVKYRLFVHNKKYLENLIHSAKKYSIAQQEYNRYSFKPSLNEKSRSLAENQFQQLSQSLMNKQPDDLRGWELLIKKGELYKDHIVQARVQKEADSIRNCTFKPKLNDQTNLKRNSQSIVGNYIQQKSKVQHSDSQKAINVKVRASQLRLQKQNLQSNELIQIQLDNHESGGLHTATLSQQNNTSNNAQGFHHSLDIHIESPKQIRKHKFRQSTTPKILGNASTDDDVVKSPKRFHNFQVSNQQSEFYVQPILDPANITQTTLGGEWIPPTNQSPLNETADFQDLNKNSDQQLCVFQKLLKPVIIMIQLYFSQYRPCQMSYSSMILGMIKYIINKLQC